MYKPGQIITISGIAQFRVVKADKGPHCARCSLQWLDPAKYNVCSKYCYRKLGNNDFDKYPYGYVLKFL